MQESGLAWMGEGEHLTTFSRSACGEQSNMKTSISKTTKMVTTSIVGYKPILISTTTNGFINH